MSDRRHAPTGGGSELSDLLTEDALRAALALDHRLGRVLEVHPRVGSTNDVARALAHAGAPEGTVVVADAQTAGRGRQGRTWFSPEGRNLHLSVVLRPPLTPARAPVLTFAAAVALAEAVSAVSGLSARLKWPNDLLLRGRKAAGILTEMNACEGAVEWVVVGIGVDVNLAPDEIPAELRESATSMRIEGGRVFSRAALFGALLVALEKNVFACYTNPGPVLASWRTQSDTLGRAVRIDLGDRVIEGTAWALAEDGALCVATAAGELRVLAGDVHHI